MTAIPHNEMKPMKQKDIRADRLFNVFIGIMVAVVLLITLYPIYLVIICSFSEPALVTSGQVTL